MVRIHHHFLDKGNCYIYGQFSLALSNKISLDYGYARIHEIKTLNEVIAIVDYGMGNLNSVKNMLKKIGHDTTISGDAELIDKADKIILPGVGSFGSAMANIKQRGLFDVLNKKALVDKIPLLGICLGMQLLTKGSEEGNVSGFGWIEADTRKFNFDIDKEPRKIPHMGWNRINPTRQHPLFANLYNESKFYFVHSYYVRCHSEDTSLAKTEYGITFDSSIGKNNIYGTQFHPEKSHKYGMQLLTNFTKL